MIFDYSTISTESLMSLRKDLCHYSCTESDCEKRIDAIDAELRTRWRTPHWLFSALDGLFNFTVDAAADRDNSLCERYWNEATDGKKQDWSGESIFCNPPYNRGAIRPWINKAHNSRNCNFCFLLPSRTESEWFQDAFYSYYFQVVFLPFRVRFEPPCALIKASSPREANVIVYGHSGGDIISTGAVHKTISEARY